MQKLFSFGHNAKCLNFIFNNFVEQTKEIYSRIT